jgi:hypothetical protein
MEMEMNEEEAKAAQDERREYVRNIGIEYRFGCYEVRYIIYVVLRPFQEKRADSCQLLAEYLEAIDLNFKEAFSLFKDNCLLRKHPQSCYKYATYVLAGKGR